MSAIQQPTLTVIGIRKSVGNMVADGRAVEWSNTVVTVLQPFSDKEIEEGAVGMKSTEYKIKGGQFFHDYQHQKLPAEAQLLFQLDVSKRTPVAQLIALDFKSANTVKTA
ncbi:hypothetical protein ACNJ69_03510 [Acinetobacter soli]|uniref:hypothetical protein n=1 Tax=Acinetobacter soli TaxID=487316 RepID=UPI001F32D6E7|nr:hypothetical protein [Acinetobacter soli]MCE6006663.1 hypothetical protein [Acinetobacter soli]MCE6006670.1 hypothetical protein [Acinetobacter soli]